MNENWCDFIVLSQHLIYDVLEQFIYLSFGFESTECQAPRELRNVVNWCIHNLSYFIKKGEKEENGKNVRKQTTKIICARIAASIKNQGWKKVKRNQYLFSYDKLMNIGIRKK